MNRNRLLCRRVVGPSIGLSTLRRGQQADGLVEADGRNLDPRSLRQCADGKRTHRNPALLPSSKGLGDLPRSEKASRGSNRRAFGLEGRHPPHPIPSHTTYRIPHRDRSPTGSHPTSRPIFRIGRTGWRPSGMPPSPARVRRRPSGRGAVGRDGNGLRRRLCPRRGRVAQAAVSYGRLAPSVTFSKGKRRHPHTLVSRPQTIPRAFANIAPMTGSAQSLGNPMCRPGCLVMPQRECPSSNVMAGQGPAPGSGM